MLSPSCLSGPVLVALCNSERKSGTKPARINLSHINFLVVGTVTNAPGPPTPTRPGCRDGLGSIWFLMGKRALCDLPEVPPVIPPEPGRVNGCDGLFCAMTRALSPAARPPPLQILLQRESHFFSWINKSFHRRSLRQEQKM